MLGSCRPAHRQTLELKVWGTRKGVFIQRPHDSERLAGLCLRSHSLENTERKQPCYPLPSQTKSQAVPGAPFFLSKKIPSFWGTQTAAAGFSRQISAEARGDDSALPLFTIFWGAQVATAQFSRRISEAAKKGAISSPARQSQRWACVHSLLRPPAGCQNRSDWRAPQPPPRCFPKLRPLSI